jgi:hypothetical protein
MYKIFLDDDRNIKWIYRENCDDWTLVRNTNEFKDKINEILNKAEDWIDDVSFDYTLKDGIGNGFDCLIWFKNICIKYGLVLPTIHFHSSRTDMYKHFQKVVTDYNELTGNEVKLFYESGQWY